MKLSQIFQSLKARNSPTRVTLQQYGTLFATYLGPQWPRVCFMALLLIGSIMLDLLGPQIIRAFIDTIQSNRSMQVLSIIALFYLGVALGSRLVAAFATYFSEDVGWNATNRLRADLTRHCLSLDRSFHAAHTPGELLERVDSNVETLAYFFSQFVIRILGSGILMLGILVLIACENIWFGAILGAYLIMSNIIFFYVQQRATSIYQLHWQAEAELSGFWGELFHGLEDIAASGAGRYIMRRYFHLQRRENSTEIKSIVFWAGFECTGLILDVLSLLIVLILSASLFVQDMISLGTLVLLLTYTTQLLNHALDIAEQLGSLQQATASIERINEIYHTQSCVQDGLGVTFPTGALALTFQGVSFSYEAEQTVLHDISFQLAAGEVVGLIGRTGSGKTTLMRLLMRFYDPTSGSVYLGGHDLRQAHLDDLRARIGLVTQEVQLFQGTLRDNLTFFADTIPDQRILEAIEQLGMSTWYERLPEGLDTELSSDGGGLSAGEAQLLACIRVFLQDPQLIILDEATSRLDPATEKALTQATQRLIAGRTALVIAHRLSTVEHVDHIMVLDDGRILEYNTRATLACDPTSYYSKLLRMTNPKEMLA
ncbi:ABC transporter ATP-binding protein [Tengunoibacter tsumagoiensis]|uniref:Helicase n=1 Tax=Tengunoibacter tsumagoiensis TaxID=2014871 RepID=A0A402A8W0_9CHLR|nr:ABC transporter ATP-binding protein [Tengunoibacter tsumagoiensis]GCE15592.1 helicase [Tengunoibacter tsumagoiensis]